MSSRVSRVSGRWPMWHSRPRLCIIPKGQFLLVHNTAEGGCATLMKTRKKVAHPGRCWRESASDDILRTMAHVHRFYIPPGSEAGFEIPLPPDEAHHAVHVVRVRSGERVVLFDGQGREIEGSVSRLTHREVFILPDAERRVPAPTVQVALLQAWLLREKSIEHLIRHGTEIGISQFCFFRARHSEKAPRLSARWQRYAIEACKQCARSWLPTFQVVADLNAALDLVRGPLLIATQSFAPVPIAEALRGVRETCSSITLLAGPEGDFSPEELQLASDHAAIPVSLGAATYRSEVAATLAASLILYELGSLGPTSTRPHS